VVVVGVILLQSTRQLTVDRKVSEISSNRAPAVISGGPAAAMRSPGTGVESTVASNTGARTAEAPQQPVREDAKAENAFLAGQRPQAPINTEAPRKTTAGELGDLALKKDKAVDAIAVPPSPANEAKPVPLAVIPSAANQINLSMSNSPSNSVMNVQNLPTQQATVQTAQAMGGGGGGGRGGGKAAGQAAGVQQAAAQQTQQANVQQATATQQATVMRQADGSQRRMALDIAAAEARPEGAADVAASKVNQAIDEARLLLEKDGKKIPSKKIGSRTFYRTANFWVDASSLAHVQASPRDIARDSKEFTDILAKEKKLTELKDAPILIYWDTANCLIR
jgi:hypothetical protein